MTKTNSPTTWFVGRHQGTIEWVKQQKMHIDHFVQHLSDECPLHPGDIVIGTLPVHIVAKLNQNGVRFVSIQFDIEQNQRGKEVNSVELARQNIQLKEYIALSIDA